MREPEHCAGAWQLYCPKRIHAGPPSLLIKARADGLDYTDQRQREGMNPTIRLGSARHRGDEATGTSTMSMIFDEMSGVPTTQSWA